MNSRENIYPLLILAVMAIIIFVILNYTLVSNPLSCTNVSLDNAGEVLFTNDEDTHFRDFLIGFSPIVANSNLTVWIGFHLYRIWK